MKISSWNINGYRAVTGQNKTTKNSKEFSKNFLFDYISSNLPDIICLQEIKANQEQIQEELQFPTGYSGLYFSAIRKGYSGVLTFSKKEIQIEHSCGFDIEKFDSEGRVIISHHKNFTLLNVYFPNGQMSDERLDYKLDFYENLFQFVENLRKKQPNILICGDFNIAHKPIDLTHPKANEKRSGFLPIERAELDRIISLGYVDIFREFNKDSHQYTWWSNMANSRSNNVGWRIDYFFGTKEILPMVNNCWLEPTIYGSDHCPVVIELRF